MASDESNEFVFALIGIGVAAIVLGIAAWLAWRLVRFYRTAPASKRMFVVLGALAVFHLLGIISFFTFPFAFDTPRNLLTEVFEIEFWVFPATFVSIWGLISLFVMLRYRCLHLPGEERTLRLFSLGVCAALFVVAIGAVQLAPAARPLFASFGADLPAPTLLFMEHSWAFFLLPAAAAVVAVVPWFSADIASRSARIASGCLVGSLALANAAFFGALGSLYLPFFGCGSYEMGTGFTRLHAAAALGREASARRHIAAGAPVNAQDQSGETPLQVAVSRGYASIARVLLEEAADPNSATSHGRTSMHVAAALGRTDIAELLLARGARVDTRRIQRAGQPLHLAANYGHLTFANLLLERGADVNAENEQGSTPLDFAIDGKQTRVAEFLERHGGVRSTKESRQHASERVKTQANIPVPFGSCSV